MTTEKKTKSLTSRQTALITGGAVRLGKALALAFAQEGYNIVLHYNKSKNAAVRTAEEIKKYNVNCTIIQADLTDEKALLSLISKALKLHKVIDVLVNSASIFERSNVMETTPKQFDEHFAINLKAPFFLTQSFAKLSKKGHVIHILDSGIVKNKSAYAAYLLSKKTLAEFTKMAALELGPNVRVNAVAPGAVLPSSDWPEEKIARLEKMLPLKKRPSEKEVTNAAIWLQKSSDITGQILYIDGGEHII